MSVSRRAKVALGLVVAAGLVGIGVMPLARRTTIHITEPARPARRGSRPTGIRRLLPTQLFGKKRTTRRRR